MKLSYKNIIFCFLVSSFVFLIGCDNETPFPTAYEGATVFQVNGQLDNDVLALEAGHDDFYMYTDFELNNENILELSGAFQKNDLCTNICNEKLKIIINNHTVGFDFNLDSALYIGNYSLEPSIVTGNSQYFVNFTPNIINSNPSTVYTYLWDFGNGTTSSVANPPTQVYSDNSGYAIELAVNTQNGDNSRYKDSIINFNNPVVDCSFSFDYVVSFDSIQNAYLYALTIVDTISPQAAYDWTIDFSAVDSTLNFNSQSSITFLTPPNISSDFEVCVQKTSNQCNSQFCKALNSSGTLNYELSFDYDVQNIVTPGDTTFFSMVIIEYTTPDGVFYSSELGSQTGSTFEILNIFDHDDNERGQNTKRIEAAVNCKLYNQNGNSIDFISNDLIFGVSIPD